MTLKRVVLPLFLTLLAFFLIFPHQAYAPLTNIKFKSFCDAGNGGTATSLNCTLSGVSTGDSIISNIFGEGAFNSFTTTDGQSNSYSQKISSITGSGSGVSTYIQTTLATASGGSLTVTVATGGPNRIYEIVISDYSGVNAFGNSGNDQQDSAGNSGTSSISLSATSGSSVFIDDFTSAGSTLTISQSNGQTIRDAASNGGFLPCQNKCQAADSQSPIVGWTWSGGSACGCFISHSVLEMVGNPATSNNFAVSQCYGNCGNPPVTIVNTNSTHNINFNQSITLFYEFQSNLNGFVQNYSLNTAAICGAGSRCSVNTLYTALYTIANCAVGNTPFSAQCPGSRVSAASTTGIQKQRFTAIASTVPVYAGQWVGVAVSASFNGVDINDTNTNVQLFQTNGITPTTIASSTTASGLCAGCKMGLWAWINGNVVTSGPSTTPSPSCGSGIGDFLQCLTLSFCTGTPNSGCQLAGGFFWAMVYSAFGIIFVVAITKKAGASPDIIPQPVYFFIPISVFFTFIALGALPAWVAFLFFIIAAFIFADLIVSRGRRSSTA